MVFGDHHGHNTLYLAGDGLFTGMNSKGPAPWQVNTLCKIPVSPNLTVQHVQVHRQGRWIEIPPGSLQQIVFFVRDAFGNNVSLQGRCSMSFVVQFGRRD